MKVTIIECLEYVTKDGELKYKMGVMGTFSDFGKLRVKIVDVNLKNLEHFKKYESQVGKQLELDLIFQLPTFPLTLV